MGTSTWQEAERNAAAFLRAHGFPDARITNAGSDGGVDVRGAHIVAQVKRFRTAVGRPALMQLAGAALLEPEKQGAFFTLTKGAGTYTTGARDYAATVGIALFTYTTDGRVFPLGKLAQKIARTGDNRPGKGIPNSLSAQAQRNAEAKAKWEAKRAAREAEKRQGFGGRG